MGHARVLRLRVFKSFILHEGRLDESGGSGRRSFVLGATDAFLILIVDNYRIRSVLRAVLTFLQLIVEALARQIQR